MHRVACLSRKVFNDDLNQKKKISKVTSKLQGYKVNCLSKARRIVLLQSQLELLQTHTMWYFQLSKKHQ